MFALCSWGLEESAGARKCSIVEGRRLQEGEDENWTYSADHLVGRYW